VTVWHGYVPMTPRFVRRMDHLLVTNDFAPKIGGIQSYLWELWRRLPSDSTTVFTPSHPGDAAFDAAAPMSIVRTKRRVLLPTPSLLRDIVALAQKVGVNHIVLDPALPVGALGPLLKKRGFSYSVVLHGAEVTIPGRLPILSVLLRWVLREADHVISAGRYPLAEAQRCAKQPLPATVIPPGVDVARFQPAMTSERNAARAGHGLPPLGGAPVVFTASRHVPRKGIDTLIDTCAAIAPKIGGVCLAIASSGRQTNALKRRAHRAMSRSGGSLDVRFLGRVDDDALVALYAAADVNATLCRTRWLGLEQEGFGIIFVEGAASGVASLAGDSGGSGEAVTDGLTGAIVPRPVRASQAIPVLERLLSDREQLAEMGENARKRAEAEFDYDDLAQQLAHTLTAISDVISKKSAVAS
jgi:phosphatidyl-myo-inositol dimannoside synthase